MEIITVKIGVEFEVNRDTVEKINNNPHGLDFNDYLKQRIENALWELGKDTTIIYPLK